jgi:hypothetical protein
MLTGKPDRDEVQLNRDAFAPELDVDPAMEEDNLKAIDRIERKTNLYKAMEKFCAWRIKSDPHCYDNVKTSKIGRISEGGCKTRTVAIGDFFTQDALKPIHKSLYRVLRKIDTDGTSSHDRISQIVKSRTSEGSPTWSFDLSNATDRFPRFIEKEVMSVMYGPKVAFLWEKLMVDRDFYVAERKSSVRYAVGQPMGLLSSWASFALTHHVVIKGCASKVGISDFDDYVIIGDDVTIFNESVADEYVKFLSSYQVDISWSKSLHSMGKPSCAEIAKRIFKDGEELSPIPYDAIETALNQPLLFPNLIKLCIERGVVTTESRNIPDQSTLLAVYKSSTAFRVLTLLSYPGLFLPFMGSEQVTWYETPENIQVVFNTVRKDYIASKARVLYEVLQSPALPDMGTLGVALVSDDGPAMLSYHPLFILLRSYRSNCGLVQNWIITHGGELSLEDSKLIPFLINPMIPNFVRRSHLIEKTRSTLILKTYQAIKDAVTEDELT